MKKILKVLLYFITSCLGFADVYDKAETEKKIEFWSKEVKANKSDVVFHGIGLCRLYVKKGTVITNNSGIFIRFYGEGKTLTELIDSVSAGNKSFASMLQKMKSQRSGVSEEVTDWIPFQGEGESLEILEDMIILVTARKGGLMQLGSKAGGFPFLVMESPTEDE